VSTGAALGRGARDHVQLVAGIHRDLSGPVAAFVGSLMAVAIVYALAQARHRGLSTTVLLLAGVTMNAFFSAMILFVQYFSSFRRHLPHAAVADGGSRRQQLPADSRGAADLCCRVCGVRVAGAAR
jgi:ABC-type Fe3+-siderophore transport system permease subunit